MPYNQPNLRILEEQSRQNSRFGMNVAAMVQSNAELLDVMKKVSKNTSVLAQNAITRTNTKQQPFNFDNIQSSLEKHQSKLFSTFNRLNSKMVKGFNLDWMDKFEKRMAQQQEKFLDKFQEEKAEYYGLNYNEVSLVTRSANALISRYDSFEHQQLALLSGIYDIARYDFARTIQRDKDAGRGSAGNVIENISNDFSPDVVQKLAMIVKSLPFGLGMAGKVGLTALRYLVNPEDIIDKLKVLPFRMAQKLGLRYGENESQTVLKKSGLYSSPEQKAYAFLGQALPKLEAEKKRIMYLQLEVQENIYEAIAQLNEGLTGQRHTYQYTQKGNTKEEFYDPLTAEYVDKQEHIRRRKERTKAITQELRRDRGIIKSAVADVLSIVPGLGGYVQSTRGLAKKGTEGIYAQTKTEFKDSQEDRKWLNYERDLKERSNIRFATKLGGLGLAAATGGLGPLMSLFGLGQKVLSAPLALASLGGSLAGTAGSVAGTAAGIYGAHKVFQFGQGKIDKVRNKLYAKLIDKALKDAGYPEDASKLIDVSTMKEDDLQALFAGNLLPDALNVLTTVQQKKFQKNIHSQAKRNLHKIAGLDLLQGGLFGLGSLSPHLAGNRAINSIINILTNGFGASGELADTETLKTKATVDDNTKLITNKGIKIDGLSNIDSPIISLLTAIKDNTLIGTLPDKPIYAVTRTYIYSAGTTKHWPQEKWPEFAKGGKVIPGQPAWVGEKGPEILFQHPGSKDVSITPLHKMKGFAEGTDNVAGETVIEQDKRREAEESKNKDRKTWFSIVKEQAKSNVILGKILKAYQDQKEIEKPKSKLWSKLYHILGGLIGGALIGKGISSLLDWVFEDNTDEKIDKKSLFKKVIHGLIIDFKKGGIAGSMSGTLMGAAIGASIGALSFSPFGIVGGMFLGGALGGLLGWIGGSEIYNDAKEAWNKFDFKVFWAEVKEKLITGGTFIGTGAAVVGGLLLGGYLGALAITPFGIIGGALLVAGLAGILGWIGGQKIKEAWDNFDFKSFISSSWNKFIGGSEEGAIIGGAVGGASLGLIGAAFGPVGFIGGILLGGAIGSLIGYLNKKELLDEAYEKILGISTNALQITSGLVAFRRLFNATDLIATAGKSIFSFIKNIMGSIGSLLTGGFSNAKGLAMIAKGSMLNEIKTAFTVGLKKFNPITSIIFGFFDIIKDGYDSLKSGKGFFESISTGLFSTGEGGFMSMLKGVSKYAALGATIGLAVPVVGPPLGALLGTILGGIIGWLGDIKIGDLKDSFVNKFKDFFTSTDLWKNGGDTGWEIGYKIGWYPQAIMGYLIGGIFGSLFNWIASFDLGTKISGFAQEIYQQLYDKSPAPIKKTLEYLIGAPNQGPRDVTIETALNTKPTGPALATIYSEQDSLSNPPSIYSNRDPLVNPGIYAPLKASGGAIPYGTPFIAGDGGPMGHKSAEMIIPTPGGIHVLNNRDTMALGGSNLYQAIRGGKSEFPLFADGTDQAKIALLDKDMQSQATQVIDNSNKRGANLRVTQTTRSMEDQAKLYAKGRSAPGPKVTNAPPGSSAHNFGMAMDVVPLQGNTPIWNTSAPQWKIYGEEAAKVGLDWGGNWKSFKDYPHIQLPDWRARSKGKATGKSLYSSLKDGISSLADQAKQKLKGFTEDQQQFNAVTGQMETKRSLGGSIWDGLLRAIDAITGFFGKAKGNFKEDPKKRRANLVATIESERRYISTENNQLATASNEYRAKLSQSIQDREKLIKEIEKEIFYIDNPSLAPQEPSVLQQTASTLSDGMSGLKSGAINIVNDIKQSSTGQWVSKQSDSLANTAAGQYLKGLYTTGKEDVKSVWNTVKQSEIGKNATSLATKATDTVMGNKPLQYNALGKNSQDRMGLFGKGTIKLLNIGTGLSKHFVSLESKYGLPSNLLTALAMQESNGNPNAIGDGGKAVGMFQIHPGTASDLGLNPVNRNDPYQSAEAAAKYLSQNYRIAKQKSNASSDALWKYAIAGYNWGPGGMTKYIQTGRWPGKGDPNYIKNVLSKSNVGNLSISPNDVVSTPIGGSSSSNNEQGLFGGLINSGQQALGSVWEQGKEVVGDLADQTMNLMSTILRGKQAEERGWSGIDEKTGEQVKMSRRGTLRLAANGASSMEQLRSMMSRYNNFLDKTTWHYQGMRPTPIKDTIYGIGDWAGKQYDKLVGKPAVSANTNQRLRSTMNDNPTGSLDTPVAETINTIAPTGGNNTSIPIISNNSNVNSSQVASNLLDKDIEQFIHGLCSLTPNAIESKVQKFAIGNSTLVV